MNSEIPRARINRVTILGKRYEAAQLKAAAVLMAPALLAVLVLFIAPVIQVIIYSFTNLNTISGTMRFNGIDNYKYLLQDERFFKSLRNTTVFSVFKLTFDTGLALVLALMLDAHIPWKPYLRSAYFVPVVVPLVASSLIWLWFFDPGLGPFNQVLGILGIPQLEWIYHENSALLSIVFFSVWKGMGYNIILFLAGLQTIPDSYIEAAVVDGARSFQILWRIKLPLLWPIISFVVMIGIINTFKVFAEINVMTPKGGPLYSTALIVVYIYDQGFGYGRMGRACAASIILFFIIFALTQFQRKLDAKKSISLE